MTDIAIDPNRTEALANRLVAAINDTAMVMMTSIGHRTGLFDTMADLPASTSGEIAAAADLSERYVREWLGAMVTAGIVELDPSTARYRLPPEHAACLTRAVGGDNIAVTTQWINVLSGVEDEIVGCFERGGGLTYDSYPRFHEVMAEESGQTVLPALVDTILPLAPGSIDGLRGGIDVLDIGCGAGRALMLMARAFPNSRFTGFDLSKEAVGRARAEAARDGITNVRFELQDVAVLGTPHAFDLVTAFDVIHDQADPVGVLASVHRVLRKGGTFLMQDIKAHSEHHRNVDHPLGTFLYTISCMHCMSVSLAQGGAGLGTAWGTDTAQRMLADAGFATVQMHELEHDIMNAYFVASKG